jgi:hypothetical protein
VEHNDLMSKHENCTWGAEFRFKQGDLKGAYFADAGNIWNVRDNVTDPKSTFTGVDSLKDTFLVQDLD